MEKSPPSLRCRENNVTRVIPAGTAVIGKAVATDGEVVTIEGARSRRSDIFLRDLEELLGGEDLTFGLMIDAVKHADHIKIAVSRDRLSYANENQLQRFKMKSSG